ncbi:acid phosphatase, putative [Acanthamoeba castellanii str. Neff]|uniref:Acid phosphatase, putative n=1 Tax=Acanthamoeba castellanii (strain ATCC 30010 / Neff) TaxID=1257118 RepID=L8HK72_ACACF|nr:acid phosphatase, putative [Acanthamoeba castellanii str. Neff]ELR24806.1 acid phosphatase, putative [Acanthamoeba castellanii str. Neff]
MHGAGPLAVFCVLAACLLTVAQARDSLTVDRTLRLRADGSFKIVQFADIHFGEGEDVWWGPVQDTNSTRLMRAVLQYATTIILPFQNGGYRWAAVFGNHDDLADGSGGRRSDLMRFDTSFPLSLSHFGPPSLHGVSNYYLPILPHAASSAVDAPVSLLYLFDTGGGRLPEIVDKAQVDWYRNLSASLRQQQDPTKRPVPALAFFHIPLEHYDAIFSPTDKECFGEADDDVTPVDTSNGLFEAFVEMGDVRATFVGHDHGNDWCCQQKGVHLCFGRHSGYGGYGTWARGARVIELRQFSQNEMLAKTWVRMEDGSIRDGGQLF